MRYSIRMSPRERATIMNIRLDSILSQRVLYEIPQVNELFEALIFYSDFELEQNSKLAVEIPKYFSYKKDLPLKIRAREQAIAEDRVQLGGEDIQDNELEEELGALQFSYNPAGMAFTSSGNISQFADDKINSIITKIFNVQDPNEIKISNSELIKGFVHFLANDITFQTRFRTYMYIGSLYGLKYNEMGAIIDGVISAIDEENFVSFRDAFIKDYDLFNAYLNNELKWKNKFLTKNSTGESHTKNSTGEFTIFDAVENYFILFFMTKMIRYNFPYFTCLDTATFYRCKEHRKYESETNIARDMLSYFLLEIKVILENTMRDQKF